MLRKKKKGKYGIVLFTLILLLFSIGISQPLFSPPSSINSDNSDSTSDNLNIIHTSDFAPPQESQDNYAAALQKAIYFYQEQRSGDLPENNTVIWRGDSFLNDGEVVGLDLTGGYYNDGGYLKLGLPLASAITTLAWSVYEYQTVFENIGQLDEILDAIKWGTDYLLKCHPSPNEFYFHIGDISTMYDWRGPVETAYMFVNRPSYKVDETHGGSAVVAASSAALALSSIIFNETNPDYAINLTIHAEQLDNLAWKMESDDYYNTVYNSFTRYQSHNGFYDELSASGILLYLRTGNITYLEKAENAAWSWPKEGPYFQYMQTHSWDDMHYMAQIFLSRETTNRSYVESIERNLDYWSPAYGTENITYTNGGLAYLNPTWAGEGALRFSANAAFLASVWSDDVNCTPTNSSIYRKFAESQINYTLGDNPYGRSYLIGFGNSSWQNINHRTAHGSWSGSISDPIDNRHILYGALVSGPRGGDFWNDDRAIPEETGVAIDYNAGIIGALAKMTDLYGGTPYIDFPNASWFRPKNETGLEYYGNSELTINGTISTRITVDLTNHGTWPAKVTDMLSYRYYLNLTEVFEAGYTIDNITIDIDTEGGIEAIVSNLINLTNNIYYVVVDYSGIAIYPGRDDTTAKETTITFSLPISAPDTAWDPTNDWSFQGLNSSRHPSEYIPIYDNNVLIYGKCPVNDTTPPIATITGLNTTVIDSSQIRLDWDFNPDPDIYGYNIYREIYSGFDPNGLNRVGQTITNHYLDTMLYENTTYYYIVIPIDSSLNLGTPSNEVNATTDEDLYSPAAPTNVSTNRMNSTAVFIDWNDNIEPDLTKYFIYRSTNDTFIADGSSFLAESFISEYLDINSSIESSYYYIIVAVDINDNLSNSSLIADAITPLIVTGLNITFFDSSQIRLNWTANTYTNLYSYYIYRNTYSGFEANNSYRIGESFINGFNDTLLFENTTYYYIVRAVDNSLNIGPSSNEVNATTAIDSSAPASPTNVSTPIVNSTEIFLDWDDNIEIDVVGYLIYRSIHQNFTPNSSTFLAQTIVSEYLDTNISAGITYYYKIVAVDINGYQSGPSYEISATVPSIVNPRNELMIVVIVILGIIMTLLGSVYVLARQKPKRPMSQMVLHEQPKEHKVFIKSEVDVLDNSRLIHIFEEEELLQRIDHFKDITITILEEDFLENIEKLDWDDDLEKKTFIKEMLVLTPDERQKIIKEMLNDYYNQSKK
ncbi:MAG: glycoside hydrolase family 9 protein [Candidatus Lokiarchaeota archaeon]|nr:glycoside hydrolase family 9 protein [Candidatus Lokiarchaeota archaeon]